MPMATNELMNRSRAVREIADRIADRTHFVMISPTHRLARLVYDLAEQTPQWCAYLDSGSGMVLRTPHAGTVAAIKVFIETAGVVTVPKTVPAAKLAAVVDQPVPEDGSQDLVVLYEPGEPMFWPTLFVNAIDLVDPKAAATIRANQIQNLN